MRILSKTVLALSLLILSATLPASARQTETDVSFQLETTLHCPFSATPSAVRTIAWSDDQKVIAFDITSGLDDQVCVYDTANLNAPLRIIDGGLDVRSAGGYLLAQTVNYRNSEARWFDVRTDEEPLPAIKGFTSSGDFAFSHNGHYIFTDGYQPGIRLWDAQTKKLLVHSNLGTFTTGAAFNRDDTRLAMLGDGGLELWTIYPGPLITQDKILPDFGQGYSANVVFGGRDGNLAAFSNGGTQIDLYDLTTEQLLQPLENTDYIRGYTFDRTGLRLAVAAVSGTRIWDIENRTLLADLTDNPSAQNNEGGVAFKPDGTEIAIGRADGGVELYRITG